jgi:hypothetical protein
LRSPPGRPGIIAPHIKLHEGLGYHGVVVQHVVGEASLRRRGVAAQCVQPLLDFLAIAFDRFLRIRRILAVEEIDPGAGARRPSIAVAGRGRRIDATNSGRLRTDRF